MRYFLLGLAFLSPVFAQTIDLKNDREGESFYSSRSHKRAVKKTLSKVDGSQILGAFSETVQELEVNKLCSFDVHDRLLQKLRAVNPGVKELKGAILYLRYQNEYDDAVTKLLLSADETLFTDLRLPKIKEDLKLPSDEKTVEEAVKLLSQFPQKLQNTCFDEAFKNIYAEISRLDKGLKDHHVEALFVEAVVRRAIPLDIFLMLEKGRVNELHKNTLTLHAYYKKLRSLRNQFPLRDPQEQSSFITKRAGDLKASRRQRLYEGYSDIQIMLMANVVKKLRTRLESPRAEILIYDRNQGVETIALEPMERFRLAIKLLRKEMSLLALNTYFSGRSPSYMDLMAAAYETGLIPASELEEVAGIEEIWNPKKSLWEKASVWVRTLSSVATIAVPPPYGFVPALAVVVIEMTTGKKKNEKEDPTVLF